MSVLFLIGPRGSGKSLAAKLLAGKYACRSVDTDTLIVETTGKRIADIVAEEGWAAFREYEKEALREAASRMALPQNGGGRAGFGVVATGGGIVLDAANRAFMRKSGIVAYLTASPDFLIERLLSSRNMAGWPSLSDLSFEEEVRATMAARDPLYREAAHHFVNAALNAETVAQVLYETIIRNKD
jgi:shikimate kinase